MIENFDAYIDMLGELTDAELFNEIDDMEGEYEYEARE